MPPTVYSGKVGKERINIKDIQKAERAELSDQLDVSNRRLEGVKGNSLDSGIGCWQEINDRNLKRWESRGSTGFGKTQDYVLKLMMYVQLQKGEKRNSDRTQAERNQT